MTTQFIGPEKVIGVTKEEMQTPAGGEVFRVVYSDNKSELMTKKSFDLLVTKEPTDYNSLEERKFQALVPEVISLLMEYDLRNMEIGRFFKKVIDSIEDNYNRASNWLWTKDDSQHIPSITYDYRRTLIECDNILKGIPKKKDVDSEPAKTE